MPPSLSSYRDAGVDIDKANIAKKRIKTLARRTFTKGVLTEIGGFGGLFALDKSKRIFQPVLVSSVDGVGTKLKVAFATGVHHTVGRDLVAHCVNDIIVQGATPLFFMDYIATGRMVPEIIAKVVEGVAAGCREAGCALLGGETAEMPGFYQDGEYDLAGFIVGVVEKSKILDGSSIRPGDVILGLPSAGLHTNGYSLARKLLLERSGYNVETRLPGLKKPIGETLLAPHLNYLPVIKPLLDRGCVKGLAHITGGGLSENIPRVLPSGSAAVIRIGTWPGLPIFGILQKLGRIDEQEMLRTFNMGIGMVVIVSSRHLTAVQNHFKRRKQPVYQIGEIRSGKSRVVYEA
jgi:phosphoribosylformylglycinamidine cyclo-ligase